MEERPVVVDSLLCFLANFRPEPNLEALVIENFSPSIQCYSRDLLSDILVDITAGSGIPQQAAVGSGKDADNTSIFKEIIELFDRIRATGRLPIFAAANLTCLPMVLRASAQSTTTTSIPQQEGRKSDEAPLVTEIRQVRHLLQDMHYLLQHEPPQSKNGCVEPMMHFVNARALSGIQIFPSSDASSIRDEQHSSSSVSPPAITPDPVPTATTPIKSKEAENNTLVDSPVIGNKPDAAVNPKSRRLAQLVSKLASLRGRDELRQREEADEETDATVESPQKSPEKSTTSVVEPSTPNNDNLSETVAKTTNNRNNFANLAGVLTTTPSAASSLVYPSAAYLQMIQMLTNDCNSSKNNTNLLSSSKKSSVVADKKHPDSMELDEDARNESVSSDSYEPHEYDDDENGPDFLDEEKQHSSRCTSSSPSDTYSKDHLGFEKESDDKPYYCSVRSCNKRFKNKFLLKKHEFIHTGLKPHLCPFCLKGFNRKDNLLRHHKTHLANAVNEGGRRRHNMLHGVTEAEMAKLSDLFTSSGSGFRKSGRVSKAKGRASSALSKPLPINAC